MDKKLQPMDSMALQSYTGKDRYTITIEVDGESVEVTPEEEPKGDGAAVGDAAIVIATQEGS